MTVKQQISKKKLTGGKIFRHGKINRYELGRDYIPTRLSDKNKIKSLRVMGGNKKLILLNAKYVNVVVDKKSRKIEIENVIENKANPNFVRRNIITKGSVLKTKLGKVIVTSRPGQDGIVNGKLLK